MKRIAVVLGIMFAIGAYSFADTNADNLVSYMETTYKQVAEGISTPLAPTMTIYNSAGSVYTADTRDFLGIKIGVGIGVVMPSSFISMLSGVTQNYVPTDAQNNTNASIFSSVAQAAAMVPMPYDMIYLKIGMIKLPLIPQFDVGIRLGFLPDVGSLFAASLPTGVVAKTGGFHIGGEARAKIIDAGVFQIGLNLAVDFDNGGLEYSASMEEPINVPVPGGFTQTITSKYTTGINFGWMGTSIGGKLIAALNIPVFSLYAGVGINFNIGSVTTTMYTKGEMVVVTDSEFFRVEGVSTIPYYFTEIRAIAGFQLLIINAAIEYSINTGAISIVLHPLTLTF
ncbi:MAG: hypothetical protein A2014_05725 [Spirochaetes bacterium GWF1_49_6]|nr:MAG: hypothetical protein A2014_05725 [Spirochaetes bacterium GWF1_49_6]